jgi:hypothetical protein
MGQRIRAQLEGLEQQFSRHDRTSLHAGIDASIERFLAYRKHRRGSVGAVSIVMAARLVEIEQTQPAPTLSPHHVIRFIGGLEKNL